MSKASQWNQQNWLNPPGIFRGAPFWAWNDKLLPERLCRQIEQMHQAGMGGFFMHSRYGLKTAYLSQDWFDCVSACVEKARELDMKAYLYDEDRWPSGDAGGIATRNRPELGSRVLASFRDRQPPEQTERLGGFAVRFDADGCVREYRPIEDGRELKAGESLVSFACAIGDPIGAYNDAPYADLMNSQAVAEFVHVTHQGYADRFGKDFGGVVPAIFTDEPTYYRAHMSAPDIVSITPWTDELPRQFKNRRGYDLRDHLVELVYPIADKPFSKVRHDYYRTCLELFLEAFSTQIGDWCDKHGIALTGHYLGEGSLSLETACAGSTMPHYEHQQWPGIDMLCDQIDEISTAKQCSSVASQLGKPRVLSEMYGCTGWDWPLEGHKFNGGWQYALGVNFRCPHLSWYSMAGGAKRDYPASIFPHSPWWKYYRLVEDYFARLSLTLTQGTPVRDVLIVHPIESAWGLRTPDKQPAMKELEESFTSLLRLLLDQQYDYDLGDESLLAKYAKISEAGELAVGRMSYRLVVVPPSVTLRAGTVELLKRFRSSGGQVVFVGKKPERMDCEPSKELAALFEQSICCADEADVIISTLEDLLPRRVSITEDGRRVACVWTMLRQLSGGSQMLFLQSVDRQNAHKLRVSVAGRRPVMLWDAQTGKTFKVDSRASGGQSEFDLELPPTGSALLTLGSRVPSAEATPAPSKVAFTIASNGPWKIRLTEPNVLPLDYCRYRIGEDAFSEPVPVLLADHKIRDHFGLPRRGGEIQPQPWYLAATGRADRTPRGRCELKFHFHVTDRPEKLQVAIERPEDYQIILNGKTVPSTPTGWWIGEEEQTVDLTSAVVAGDNELLLRFDYRSDMDIEDLHLVGLFGVKQIGAKRTPDGCTLVAPPTELKAGSWVGQGLDFYGAAVEYRLAAPPEIAAAVKAGKRVRLSLPGVKCACAAMHVGDQTTVLPWAPMSAEITGAGSEIVVEVIGGRHNSLGPLHTPWEAWTGPYHFDPAHKAWTFEYHLNDHGLMAPPTFEILE